MSAPTISFLSRINAKPQKVQAATAVEMVSKGNWKIDVEDVRAASSDEERDRAKKRLPAFMVAGIFESREAAALVQHSGLICLDLDHVGQVEAPKIRDAAFAEPSTYAAFVSPSGAGVKIWVSVAGVTAANHKQAFEAVAAHYASKLAVTVDSTGSDLVRLCFVSYDSAAKWRTTPSPFSLSLTHTSYPLPRLSS